MHRLRIGSVGIWDILTFDPIRHAHGGYVPGGNLQELTFMQVCSSILLIPTIIYSPSPDIYTERRHSQFWQDSSLPLYHNKPTTINSRTDVLTELSKGD